MNNVVHFEIPAEDTERAQEFYKKLFGWKIEKAGDMPYWMCRTGECDEENMPKEPGFINGGIMKKDESSDPGSSTPSITIKVENIDDTLEKVKESGGEVVMEPRTVMDMGKHARIKDSEGNIVGIWQDLK